MLIFWCLLASALPLLDMLSYSVTRNHLSAQFIDFLKEITNILPTEKKEFRKSARFAMYSCEAM